MRRIEGWSLIILQILESLNPGSDNIQGAIMPEAVIEQDRQAGRSFWFGLLAGPIVYSLHFVAVYLLVEAACRTDLLRFTWLGLDGIALWVLALTLIAALVTGYSTVTALRNWRRSRPADRRRNEENAPLMAQAGIWLGGYFTVAILLTGLPAIFLTICGWI
jgi:hypothetical protein